MKNEQKDGNACAVDRWQSESSVLWHRICGGKPQVHTPVASCFVQREPQGPMLSVPRVLCYVEQ